ncbi:hypothetical protein FDECE_8321 [Fusarium decemcellulare]|nr:hypothetical protein FDECE_8321 [Fusarium decemcellulare]
MQEYYLLQIQEITEDAVEGAKTYELMFTWSDTCCIDKSSSSELDEAIRSMFRWYRNATTCFVHLAQTSSLDDLQFDEWFERGWTLQELLAPRVTKFFSAEWQPLVDGPNDKTNKELLQIISAATHCPEHALRGYTPGPFYVGRRMTWAARRKTTRGEDMAYALMGIFDVTLQTAYGEGAERAFCRLIEKLMLANGNMSVLNWAGKPASSHSSRAFPSSPRSYLGHPEYNFERKLDISIPSLGLRIPLLVLPLKKPRSLGRTKDGTVRVELSFSDERISSVVDPITVALLRGEIIKNRDLAIGVFNYMPPYGNQVTGHPGIRPWSTGYLLSRRQTPDISQEDIQLGMKAKDDLRFYGWKKISTATFICFTVKSVQRGEVMIMDKEFLEVVHL